MKIVWKINLKEPILSVYARNSLYVALGNKFVNLTHKRLLGTFDKSVRSISGNDTFIGCGSFDGTARIFKLIDSRDDPKNICCTSFDFSDYHNLPGESTINVKNVNFSKNFIDSLIKIHKKIFYKGYYLKEEFFDVIEGPETEIKNISFSDNFISLSTRGKTVWILESNDNEIEISKILDDHTQDVKGSRFSSDFKKSKKFYSWSYDNTINVYCDFELIQIIDCGNIVWEVVFFNGLLVASLQNGVIKVFEFDQIWAKTLEIAVSVTPIISMCVLEDHLVVACNQNCLVALNSEFEKVYEIGDICSGNIYSICSEDDQVYVGCSDGTLCCIKIEPLKDFCAIKTF